LDAQSKTQQAGVNTLQLKLEEWDRRQEELSAEFTASQPPLARWNKQLEEFAGQFDRNRKTLYDMHELEQQVRQQGNEMAELQRLAVERQRTELREWQDNQVRVDDEQTVRLVRLETWQTKSATVSQSLEDRLEQNKQAIQSCSDELWQVWARFIQAQAKVLDGLKQEKPR
jgi:predicted  nucleic acid-binding Zn-ribbon protein